MHLTEQNNKLRWSSGEFIIYYTVIVLAAFKVLQSAYLFSLPDNPNFINYRHALGTGWMGRPVDKSDAQWRSFREALPLAVVVFGCFVTISRLIRVVGHRRGWSFDFVMKMRAFLILSFLTTLHGLHSIKIIGLIFGSFLISWVLKGRKANVAATWIYSLSILFALEYLKIDFQSNGIFRLVYSFFSLLPSAIPRWSITFNITVLRLISYNVDYYYAFQGYSALQHRETCKECSEDSNGDPCEKRRIQEAPTKDSFTFTNFFVYILYPPLYMAGPIITFNNFYSQIQRPIKPPGSSIFLYGLRWISSLLVLEFILHHFYVVAIKDNHAWYGFTPLDFASLSYLNLNVVWLKLLIIWRFFRLIAMLDGIVPLENMARCMTNNYSGLAFWRSWHRSFNQWIIRYMYIPLGGTRTASYNIWPIFTFVAIWHDIRLHLLLWSWLICLFILPEILLGWLARKRGWEGPKYRTWAALAAGANMILMSVVNLVGFVVGLDGIQTILGSLLNYSGMLFMVVMFAAFYSAANICLEIRETERHYGIFKNY